MAQAKDDRLAYMTPESRCMDVVEEKGFTDQFKVKGKKLFCFDNGKEYAPHEVKVVNFYRFEGISNPDDMSVIYAIETADGRKGTLTDAFGLYADQSIGEFMNAVEDIAKQTNRGWTS